MDFALLTILVLTCILIVFALTIRFIFKQNKSLKSQVSAFVAERSILQQVIRDQETDVVTAREVISQLEARAGELFEQIQTLNRFSDIRDTTQGLERLQTLIAKDTDEIKDANHQANQITELARVYADILRQ